MSDRSKRNLLTQRGWQSNGQLGQKERWRNRDAAFVHLREWMSLDDAITEQQRTAQWFSGLFSQGCRDHFGNVQQRTEYAEGEEE